MFMLLVSFYANKKLTFHMFIIYQMVIWYAHRAVRQNKSRISQANQKLNVLCMMNVKKFA